MGVDCFFSARGKKLRMHHLSRHPVSPNRLRGWSWLEQGHAVSISGTKIKPTVRRHSRTCTQLAFIRFCPDNHKFFSHSPSDPPLSVCTSSGVSVFSHVSLSYLVSSMQSPLCSLLYATRSMSGILRASSLLCVVPSVCNLLRVCHSPCVILCTYSTLSLYHISCLFRCRCILHRIKSPLCTLTFIPSPFPCIFFHMYVPPADLIPYIHSPLSL